MPVKSTAIIGAGVAGLTLALALARRGIASDIFEQADELKEVGAGLQLSPNATRILGELGLIDAIEPLWTRPRSVDLRSGITLKQLVSIPVGDVADIRWKAPYAVLHRATLQHALISAVRENSLCRLHLGLRMEARLLADVEPFCDVKPGLVAGADGVWSKARMMIPNAPVSRFSGHVAWRIVIPFSEAPPVLPAGRVTAFMAPGAHMVCYPLNDAGGFNIVAITSGVNPGETWNATGEPKRVQALRSQFGGWHPALRAVVERYSDLLYWPLCEASDGAWQNGRDAVLLGDAAHAMMPFMAQGAASAIEDAQCLATLLADKPLPEALAAFELRRKPRVARLRQRAAFNRMIYHARGPLRVARDLAMTLRPADSYIADLDWIYGYRG